MSHLDLPWWAAVPAAALLIAGSLFALLGASGLLRLRDFFARFHAPALGTSFGTVCMLLASVLIFSVGGSRLGIHEVLIYLFLVLTAPVTAMTLIRAAVYRKRDEPGPGDAKPTDRAAPMPPTDA